MNMCTKPAPPSLRSPPRRTEGSARRFSWREGTWAGAGEPPPALSLLCSESGAAAQALGSAAGAAALAQGPLQQQHVGPLLHLIAQPLQLLLRTSQTSRSLPSASGSGWAACTPPGW